MNGFSDDNYITDQDYFGQYRYRTIPSSYNGCGWMAAYNIMHYLGIDLSFDEVRKELDGLHRLRLPGPTTMNAMRKYLNRHMPEMKETEGRNEALEALRRSQCGILRYTESGTPHFVSLIRSGSGFRFFNVADGFEDFESDIDSFFDSRVKTGFVAAFYLNV